MLAYAIATTPRTGSTYLCELLREAGLGEPDEWLHAGRARTWTTLEELRALRSPGGIFGTKLFWEHREDGAIVDFDDLVPVDGGWIFLRRRDTHSQARSYLTALSRDDWIDIKVPYEEFPPELVTRTEARLRRQVADWERWFRRKRIRPLRVVFESLITNPEREVQRISDFLGCGGARRHVLSRGRQATGKPRLSPKRRGVVRE